MPDANSAISEVGRDCGCGMGQECMRYREATSLAYCARCRVRLPIKELVEHLQKGGCLEADTEGGRISDNPEAFFARWLRNIATEIEDGTFSVESHSQSFGDADDLFEFKMLLKATP